MAGVRGLFPKVVFLLICVSAFLVIGVGAEVIVADFTEADLEGHMFWGQFMDNCVEGGTPYSSGGIFDDVAMHLIVDTDKETVTGSLSGGGSFSNNVNQYTQDYSFDGSISGTAKRVFWGGYRWYWNFEADVELDLTFSTSYRCKDVSTGDYYWISREETIHVTRMLRTRTASDNNQQFMHFIISLKDFDEQITTPISFYMTHKNENEQRRAILPLEMPDPIDIDVAISGPEQIGRGDSGATFDITIKGEDVNQVQNVRWYFYFFDEVWDDYRWFESFEKDTLSGLTVDASKIEEWMEYLDDFGTTVDGVKTLPMQLYVELEADEFEWLAVSQYHNFTLSSAQSTSFKLDVVDIIDVYPTSKNETYFEFEHSGYELNKPITFEIEGNNPPYLTFEFLKTSETDISEEVIYLNRLTIGLDSSKLGGVTLPTEHKIVLKAKSSTSEGPVEDAKEITLNFKPVKWLILHYVASDTAPPLQEDDEDNIQEIISAFQESKTHQIGYNLLIDLQKDWTPPNIKDSTKLSRMKTHFLKYYDNKLELIESKNTLDMSKGITLTDFIKQAKGITPSEKIILILTDHGYGIEGLLRDHHLGIDDATMMSVIDLDKALEGHHVELLILEACLMGKIEVLYELRDKTDYIISSQLNMKASSFAYPKALKPLLKNPSIEAFTVGESFISTYDDNRVRTISLIETSKLDAVVQGVKEFASEWNKAYTENKVELLQVLENIYGFSNGDLRCLVGNIIGDDKITEYEIISAAENVQITIDAAVLTHKSRTDGILVYYKDGDRGIMTMDDGAAILEMEDEASEENKAESVGENKYYGISSENKKIKLTDEYSTKYEKFEFSRNTEWLKLMKNILSSKKDRIEVKKNQQGNNLYLRTIDSEGYVNGFDPDSDYKNRIVLDYAQAEYCSYLNGTEVIYLPVEAEEFTTHVWGGYMEEAEESYSLTYQLIIDDVVVAEQTLESPITEYTEQSVPITVSDGEITIGETTITQLEIPQEDEPVIDTDEQDSDSSSDGWIPSFPLASMILGVSVFFLLYRKRM